MRVCAIDVKSLRSVTGCSDSSRTAATRGSAYGRFDHDFVIGHVIFDEPRIHITSDFLNYVPSDERVLAFGNVNAKLPSGSFEPLGLFLVPRLRGRP